MDRTYIFLVFFCCWKCIVAGDPVPRAIQEHETITLTYDSTGVTTPRDKFWCKGYYNTSRVPTLARIIYENINDWKEGAVAKARPAEFSIIGDDLQIKKVQLEDDGYFTCKTQDISVSPVRDVYAQVAQLQVYIQPEVKITTSGESVEDEQLTVNCTVERLYPKITKGMFVMTWPGRVITDEPTSEINGPPARRYTITTTQKLTEKDNGKKITCTVTPESGFGEERSRSLPLDVSFSGQPPLNAGMWVGIGIALYVAAVY